MAAEGVRRIHQRAYSAGIISMMLIFTMSCFKWLIEGILDRPILEAVICLAAILLIFLVKGVRIRKNALIWLLYMFNILFSLAVHPSTFGLWGRGGVTILTTALVLFIHEPVERYARVFNLMYIFGLINAGLVIFHYLARSRFERAYLPLLCETASLTAQLYIRSGYYFGLLYNPHEPATLIAFAIAAILITRIIRKEHNLLKDLLCLALFIPLLITGKKAVFACGVFALAIIIMTLFSARRQFIRAWFFLLVIAAASAFFISFTLRHPEIAFFNRFNIFFQNLMKGDSVGVGRIFLYQRAIEEWKTHKLLGIGWRHFNALTVTKFRMTQSHEVNCDYLQWLCETGIIGLVLSVIPVLVMAFRTFYVCRKELGHPMRFSDTEKCVILMAAYIQIFTVLYAFVEIPFFDIVIFTMYIISCIVINSAYARRMGS